jgi:hypothetical protein
MKFQKVHRSQLSDFFSLKGNEGILLLKKEKKNFCTLIQDKNDK